MKILRNITKRIAPYLHAKGFLGSGNQYYFIENDISYCIGLDVPGGITYVTAYILPLYVPCETRYYTYGNRLNADPDICLPLLRKNAGDSEIDNWCENLCEAIDKHVLPFFKSISSPRKLAEYIEHIKRTSNSKFFCAELYIARLKVFTYLYIREPEKAERSLRSYRMLLDKSFFLTEVVRQKYENEVNFVPALIKSNEPDIAAYFSKTVNRAKQVIL